jgi:hypothetical protein
MAEGYKRSRNCVSICNSDAVIMLVAHHWITRFSRNKISYYVLYHADQNLDQLQRYWGEQLGIDPERIRTLRKSNSGGLKSRNFRSKYGVLTVRVGDTYLRARLEAWMDLLRAGWLDSPENGV